VHNLHTYASGQHPRDPYGWTVRFLSTASPISSGGKTVNSHLAWRRADASAIVLK
jgi:hypothetical protein